MTTIATDMVDVILQASASGRPYRLEYVRGRLKVEASPASRHQMTVDRIRASLHATPGSGACGCFSLADVLIRFPDPQASLKRPDIAIFCASPPESDEALDVLPVAVIEIISLGYEDKDVGEDGAPFYLACGIADVIVVDPRTGVVRHYHANGITALATPAHVTLACGCQVTV